jgi:hypothetical protein
VDERGLVLALRPWTRWLLAESAVRWLVRGGIAALATASLVLSISWLTPFPIQELKPTAFQLAAAVLASGLLVALWPVSRLRRAAELDRRLSLADRLATAWHQRNEQSAMARLQRQDALRLLRDAVRPKLRVARVEVGLLMAVATLMLALIVVPSPMENVLRQIEAEQLATQRAAERIDALAQDAVLLEALTPEQARRLDELLKRAQQDLQHAHTERAAAAVLARTELELLQLGDPNSDAREQGLAAMSETLSQEPLARSLAEALERHDTSATREAVRAMQERAGTLSEPQRQALSRALQRAANVGRADSRSSAALRDAARAMAAGEQADEQLREASASLEQAMQQAAAEAAIRAASQRVQDARSEMSQVAQALTPEEQPMIMDPAQSTYMPGSLSGVSVPIDSAPRRGGVLDEESIAPSPEQRSVGGGVGGAALTHGDPQTAAEASESIFIPGRPGDGPSDNDAVQQPFSVRGAPRPFREVISQYAQSGRDYIDRAAVPSSVRELVRQYFSDLEGQ